MLRGENAIFSEKRQNGNLPQKNLKFSRHRMMKRTSLLNSSREIYLSNQISLNSETVGFSRNSRRHASSGPRKLDFYKNPENIKYLKNFHLR